MELSVHGVTLDLKERLLFRLKDPQPLKDYFSYSDHRLKITFEELMSHSHVIKLPWMLSTDLCFAYKLSSVVDIPELFHDYDY